MYRKNYSDKVVAIFDQIGSFFVDTYYNNLYIIARDLVHVGKAASITDAYQANVINYMRGIPKKELYTSVVHKLHEYYQHTYGIVVFSDLEDRILNQFIPPEYYKDFSNSHKEKTLHEIIVKTANELGEIVLRKDMLKKIIDDHFNTANVQYLQDRMMDALISQREDYYSKFAQEINKSNGNNKVDKKTFDRLKDAFVGEKKLRCKAEEDRDRAVSMLSQLVAKIAKLENEVRDLKGKLEEPARDNLMSGLVEEQKPTVIARRGRPRKTKEPDRLPSPVEEHTESSGSDGDDPDVIYAKQRELLMRRRTGAKPRDELVQEPAETPVRGEQPADLDDPGWGS